MESRNKSFAFVIFSHSSYVDVWPILIESYRRQFRSDLFDFYITSDRAVDASLLNGSDFRLLNYAEDLAWSDAFFASVRQLDYEKFVFSFDDLILTRKVIDHDLDRVLFQNNFDYLKIICSHVRLYNRFLQFGEYFEVSKYDSYRGSLVFSILTQDLLNSISANPALVGRSAWEFERQVNRVLSSEFRYGAVRRNVLKFNNLVIKGRINPVAKLVLKYFHGLHYTGDRLSMTPVHLISYYLKLGVFTTVKYFVPSAWFAVLRKVKHRAQRSVG